MNTKFYLLTLVLSCLGLISNGQWNLTGNAGTNALTNFVGTTDAKPLTLKANNQSLLRLNLPVNTSLLGTVGVNTTYASEADRFAIASGWGQWQVFLNTQNSGKWGFHNGQNGDAFHFYCVPSGGGSTLFPYTVYNTGKMTIGNVNTTPGNYKLYVADGILTEKLKVAIKTSAQWADYVFADDYKLMPLSEVKHYITENKHLPNVPSAEEVVKSGVDMAQMDAKLLEKIEELTLYIINLESKVSELDKKVSSLKAE